MKDFKEDFKFTCVVSILKQCGASNLNYIKNNFEKVIVCIAIAERRCDVLSGRLLE